MNRLGRKVAFASMLVSRDGPPAVMAEIGVNHDGDPAVARALIEAAAAAGAQAVKFQLFNAHLLLAHEAQLVDYQKSTAESAYDLLAPLELSAAVLTELINFAHHRGLAALVTPFSPDLVAVAKSCGADGLKLASPDLVNYPLLEKVLATGLPLVLSSGAARMDEIHRSIHWLGDAANRCVLLHCVSAYPTQMQWATLGALEVMRIAWPDLPIGYSDHTTSTLTGALATAAGACMLEKHLTLDCRRPGPDHAASLEPAAMADYVRLAQEAHLARGPLVKKVLLIEEQVRQQTRQSLVTTRDLAAGTVLSAADLTVKRPGTGIPAAEWPLILGRTLIRALKANTLLKPEDLAPPQSTPRGTL